MNPKKKTSPQYEVLAEAERREATRTTTKDATTKVEQPIRIRPAVENDLAYVHQTWLKDFERGPFARPIHPRIYRAEQSRTIARLVKTCPLVIACDPEFADNILGWACGEVWAGPNRPDIDGVVIHYVYVPRQFRERRIGRRLLVELVGEDALEGRMPLFYTHLPEPRLIRGAQGRQPAVALLMAKDPQYNPYLAFRP